MTHAPTTTSATFAFDDTNRRFSDWLVKKNHPTAIRWETWPKAYHILAITTIRGLYGDFGFENAELDLVSLAIPSTNST
jgi:hypothetical protein